MDARFKCVVLLALALTPAGVLAAPATQPADASADALIRQLSSSSSSQRRHAREELARMGEAAVPRLEAAAKTAPDAQTRSDAAVVLRRIAEHNEFGPTPITLHAQGTGAELFARIAKQAGVRIEPYDLQTWPKDQPLAELSVDFDHAPFWEAVASLADRCGVRPSGAYRHSPLDARDMDSGMRVVPGEIQLQRIDPRAPRQYVGAASGAFYVCAHAISDVRAADRWSIHLMAIAEPKLRPIFWSVLEPRVIDDRQREIKPLDLDGVQPMWGRTPLATVDFTAAPGTRSISRFTADSRVVVATATRKFEAPDLSKAAGTVWLWNGMRIDIEGFEELKDGSYRLMMNMVRGNMDEAHFEECYYIVQSIPTQLLDAAGRPLLQDAGSMSLLRMNGLPVDHIRVFRTFVREAEFEADPKPGNPTKLVWELPTRLHSYDVPVSLNDLHDSRKR